MKFKSTMKSVVAGLMVMGAQAAFAGITPGAVGHGWRLTDQQCLASSWSAIQNFGNTSVTPNCPVSNATRLVIIPLYDQISSGGLDMYANVLAGGSTATASCQITVVNDANGAIVQSNLVRAATGGSVRAQRLSLGNFLVTGGRTAHAECNLGLNAAVVNVSTIPNQ